jgi:hypothetical protein
MISPDQYQPISESLLHWLGSTWVGSLRRFNARESVYTLPPLILSIPTGGTAQNRLTGTLPTELERLDLLNPRYPELSPWFQGGLVLTSVHQETALEWHETDLGRISSPGEIVERFVLAVIYFTTNGGQWYRNDLWLSGGSLCQWFGIICHEDGNISIDLSKHTNHFRVGWLCSHFVLFCRLTYLSLYSSKFQGQTPS